MRRVHGGTHGLAVGVIQRAAAVTGEDRQLRAADGLDGALDAELFDAVVGLVNSGGIEQAQKMAAQRDGFLDGVAGGPGDIGDDHAVIAAERVEKARFADVRTAEYDGADAVFEPLAAAEGRKNGGKRVHGLFQHVAVLPKLKRLDVFVGIVEHSVKM